MTNHAHPCRRCHGMMVEAYSDLLSPSARGEDVFGWRCVNCRDYVDWRVLLNRSAQGEGIHSLPAVRRYHVRPLRARPIMAHGRMEAA